MIKITGTGSYLPEKILTNKDLESMVETSDEWIVKRTGIRERHIANETQSTSDLAVIAANRALEAAGRTVKDIDLIIVATSTPDYQIPATAPIVQNKLGCDKIAAFDINSVCSGFSVSMINAYGLIASGLYKKALVIGADTYSRILNWQDRTSCCLFGDGAGAVVIERDDRPANMLSHFCAADGSGANLICVPAGGVKTPFHEVNSNFNRDNLFFKMDGRGVYEFSIDAIPQVIVRLTREAGLQPHEVDYVLLHQANIRIIDAIAKYLDIPRERYLSNVENVGNTSAASIPILLDETVRAGKIKTGDKVMMIGFGGGLSWSGFVLEW